MDGETITTAPPPWATDFDSLVENLGIPHRAKHAHWTLLGAGARAVPALKRGLSHPDPGNRKIIRWWLPGGPRFERTKPRSS